MNTKIYRPEFPNPQFQREGWINLNGEWEFELDRGVSGVQRKLYEREHLSEKINVPFCPESLLSGIGNTDFLNCVWYRRDLIIPDAWRGGRVMLHFGAVDHIARVYVNGKLVGTHTGCYASFSFDITSFLQDGINSLCVCAEDDDRNNLYGHGKQSRTYASHGCYYTRVTGIWQTVWLEYVPNFHIKSFKLTPDIYNSALGVEVELAGVGKLTATAYYEGREVGKLTLSAPHGGNVSGTLALSELHLWELGNGRLYDLVLSYGDDLVKSYFGMRHVAIDGLRFLLNGKSVYQRLVLDQGFYPEGIYTAPSDEALRKDIELSMALGFNGARLHEKVFEPRFLYHCDRMGYMVWGEYGNWGIDYSNTDCIAPFQFEWREILARDYNHPSIIGWCPFNETWDYQGRRQNDDVLRAVYYQTKSFDSTRPCIDTSGNYHVETDIYDLHDYCQDPKEFRVPYQAATPEELVKAYEQTHKNASKHQGEYLSGQAILISEYGGIKWDIHSGIADSWGYGNAPATEAEFKARYRALTDILLDAPFVNGFCYTQLYDIEQEVNGLYTYNRQPKFEDMEFFRTVNARKAAIEDESL